MEIYFSFNTKQELIILNEQKYTHEIGALLQCVTDTDWSALQSQVELWAENGVPAVCWGKHIDTLLQSVQCHPLIRKLLADASGKGTVIQEIKDLIEAKRVIKHIFETLVDEDRNEYAMRLYELFHEEITSDVRMWLNELDTIKAMPDEKILPLYRNELEINLKDFPVVFITDRLQTILFRELRFICTNHFIIRKCINCRNFFWTRSTTKMYCNRPVPLRKTNCSQYGPRRKRQMEKRPAYKLYWHQREKTFSRSLQAKDHSLFRAWLRATDPYKNRAKHGDISLEEMAHNLSVIEQRIFPTRFSTTQEML